MTTPITMHPDDRLSAALDTAIKASWQDGHGAGQWQGHLEGWRNGLLCGFCWGCLLAAIAVAAANHLGWI